MPLLRIRSRSASSLIILTTVLILTVDEPGANSRKRIAELRPQFASRVGGDRLEIRSQFAGPSHLTRILERDGVEPVAVAFGDFDEDGIGDMVCGYAAPGIGVLTLHRGNQDSLFPNHPNAANRGDYSAPPFLSSATVFELSEAPEFLGAGDFDGDGHIDIVSASRGGSSLQLSRGRGDGSLDPAQAFDVGGQVTAFAAGEFGPSDGRLELAVAIERSDGPWLVIHNSLEAAAERIALPAKISSLAMGQLDQGYEFDMALAAGRRIFVLSGADRSMKKFRMPADLSSIAIASVGDNRQDALGALLVDGSVHVLDRGKRHEISAKATTDGWLVGGEALTLIDRADRRLTRFAGRNGEPLPSISMEAMGEPVAAVAARLNFDAQSDFIILRKGRVAPAALLTPAGTFVVDNVSDSGANSLREAIVQANNTQGADIINFDLAGTPPFRITLASPLPPITDALTIDGTSQPGFSGSPIIEIDAVQAGGTANVLVLAAGNCVVFGLSISGAGANGIVSNGANNIIQGCFIGTDSEGNVVDTMPNAGNGILVNGANNTIGGTAAVARNLISANGVNGVLFQGSGATGNVVQGNLIGTNLAGDAPLPNMASGISFIGAAGLGSPSNNTVGGTTVAARNRISGNVGPGVTLNNAVGNVIQGNFIGTNLAGTQGVGNTNGVSIISASGNSIGGAIAAAANVIAFNRGNGVLVASGTGNSIRRNSIFSNDALGIDLGPAGITPNDPGDVDAGANNLQNFPVIQGVAQVGGGTLVVGVMNSTPMTLFTLEFFANPACDASGSGEGQTFVGTLAVSTDASGAASFSTTFPTMVPLNQFLTATTTDPGNNTSEFSACSQVGSPSDLAITMTASPGTAVTGTDITYTIMVTNTGPGRALAVMVTDMLPPQTTFVSCVAGSGGVCMGTGNQRTVMFDGLDAASLAVITIVARANCTQQGGTVINNTASVSAATPDSNPLNNSATATVSGAPQVRSDKTSVDLGPARARFRQNANRGPSEEFFLESTGCSPTQVTAVQILRTGSDVNSGKISDEDDGGAWALFSISPNGVETRLSVPSQLAIAIPTGQQQRFRVRFTPVIPGIAGSNTGLSADEVLPDRVDSVLILTTNSGPITINLTGRVVAGPRLLAAPSLTKSSRDLMSVRTQIWDADNNVRRLVFRFLGGEGVPEISVDVGSAIAARNLVTGQSFAVTVDFSGDNRSVTGVQVTVIDDSGASETGSANPDVTPQSLTGAGSRRGISISLGPVRLRRR